VENVSGKECQRNYGTSNDGFHSFRAALNFGDIMVAVNVVSNPKVAKYAW
jgi:hypothetical protein